jgi:hypothetical protein
MSDDEWLASGKRPAENEVAIDYLKAHDFRVVWADGVVGSITPQGHIHFALFSERPAIPRRQVFVIEKADGALFRLGREVLEKQISRGSIVREMACDVFLSPETAENLGNWLLSQVSEFKKLRDQTQ